MLACGNHDKPMLHYMYPGKSLGESRFFFSGCPENPRGDGHFPVVVIGANDEPMLQVLIADKKTPMLEPHPLKVQNMLHTSLC